MLDGVLFTSSGKKYKQAHRGGHQIRQQFKAPSESWHVEMLPIEEAKKYIISYQIIWILVRNTASHSYMSLCLKTLSFTSNCMPLKISINHFTLSHSMTCSLCPCEIKSSISRIHLSITTPSPRTAQSIFFFSTNTSKEPVISKTTQMYFGLHNEHFWCYHTGIHHSRSLMRCQVIWEASFLH